MTSNTFHIYDSEVFSGTEDKGPNVIFLKSCSNCSCHSGNSKCSGSYESETVDKDQIHEKYIYINMYSYESQYHTDNQQKITRCSNK